MGYDVAISKSWQELENATKDRALQVKFLADEYSIDLENKKILSLSPEETPLTISSIIRRIRRSSTS